MALRLRSTFFALFIVFILVSLSEVKSDAATDQVMDAIKKASANLGGNIKVDVLGGGGNDKKDEPAAPADDSDDDDDDDDDEDSEKESEIIDGVEVEKGVVVLKDETFDDFVLTKSETAPVLVEFYAPWCGHCKTLAPEYERAAKRLKSLKNPVYLAKVDATEEEALAKKYDVSGYPTLKWFRNGQAYDYDGPRQEDGIFEYMKERSSADWKPPPVAVVTLTGENFTDFINGNDLSLVEFYAPWCGHCKKLAPEYEKAAQKLKENNPSIPLAKVDATQDSELAQKYDVTGYPTLKVFRRGTAYDYKDDQGRTEYSIYDYMTKQVGDPSKLRDTVKGIQSYMADDDISVVGFFDAETDFEYQTYLEGANSIRDDYKFVHTFDKSVRDHYKVNPHSVVVFQAERYHTKYEPKRHVLEIKEDTKGSDVQDFIKQHNLPLVGAYTAQGNAARYSARPLLLAFYTVDFSFAGKKATQLWRNKIATVANDVKDKGLTFAVADEEANKDLFKAFGFEESGEEINIGILSEGDRKYPMEPMEEFDSDEIKSFIKSYLAGKIKPIVKSQPIPKKSKGPVKIVVGKNFEDIVLDPKKDVLIEMYAPWCGHCKKLEPIYKDLAKKLKSEKNLVIAKMDATANDAPPEFKAEGFPTIYFAASNDKKNPVKFEGGSREVEDFEKFLKEHATVSFGKSVKEEL